MSVREGRAGAYTILLMSATTSFHWEKVLLEVLLPNENMNRIIRRFFPKGTSFNCVTAAEVAWVERWLANYPRRILGWKTPQMLFDEHLSPAA